MGFELNVIDLIQKIRSPFLDKFFLFVTMFGDEIVFLGIGMVLFWCYDKRFALLYLFNYFVAALFVNVLKNIVKRPRPYHTNQSLGVGANTGGYSFPSGHTQCATSMASIMAARFGRKHNRPWIIAACVAWVMMVGLSRIYLGQHYLSDVAVGALIGFVISVVMWYMFRLMKDREHIYCLIVIPISIILMAVFHGSSGNHKNYFLAGGAAISMAIGYYIEKRYINYNVSQELWWIQVIKVAVAGAIALGLKEGLKPLFELMGMSELMGVFLRYFAVGAWVSLGAMVMFKYSLNALKRKFPHLRVEHE